MGRHDSCLYAVTVLEYEDDETVPPARLLPDYIVGWVDP
jgi:hypothetical protein